MKGDVAHAEEIFSLALQLFCKKEDASEVVDVLKRMKKKSVKPSSDDVQLVKATFKDTTEFTGIEKLLLDLQ